MHARMILRFRCKSKCPLLKRHGVTFTYPVFFVGGEIGDRHTTPGATDRSTENMRNPSTLKAPSGILNDP